MSEVQARSQTSSRGRGGGSRGGRGSYASRGGNSRRANGDKFTATDSALTAEDEGDVGELRKKFGSDKVETIKELFPDWSDADILYALQETDGDIEVAATRISEGSYCAALSDHIHILLHRLCWHLLYYPLTVLVPCY